MQLVFISKVPNKKEQIIFLHLYSFQVFICTCYIHYESYLFQHKQESAIQPSLCLSVCIKTLGYIKQSEVIDMLEEEVRMEYKEG